MQKYLSRRTLRVGSIVLPLLLAPLACGATVAVPIRSSVTAVPIASFHVYHPVGADERYGLACHTGELCAETLGNGDRVYYDYRYDRHDNPDALKDAAVLTDAQGRVEARVDYAYDLSGRVSAQTFSAVDGVRYALHDRYDAAGRLVEQTRDDLAPPAASTRLGFAYSADDDMRVKLTQGGHFSAESYRYDGLNRRVSTCDGGRCRIARYDVRGDALTDEHDNRYRYDDLRRTVAAGETDDTVAYAYYPDGWRADKTRDGQSLVYHYAGDTPIDAEHGDQSARWLLADGVSARVTVTDGQTRVDYPFAGRLGSVLGETDMAGAWRGSRAYRPFGRQIDKAAGTKSAKPDPLDLNRPQFGFQGEPQDPETGNTYHETRYNRGDGLWTTHDELDTINAYAAFNDDPGNDPDPDGRLPEGDALSWAQTALDVASYLPGAAGTAASLGSYALSAAQMPGGSDDGEGGLEGGDEDGGHSMPWWGWGLIGIGIVATIGAAVYLVRVRQPWRSHRNSPPDPLGLKIKSGESKLALGLTDTYLINGVEVAEALAPNDIPVSIRVNPLLEEIKHIHKQSSKLPYHYPGYGGYNKILFDPSVPKQGIYSAHFVWSTNSNGFEQSESVIIEVIRNVKNKMAPKTVRVYQKNAFEHYVKNNHSTLRQEYDKITRPRIFLQGIVENKRSRTVKYGLSSMEREARFNYYNNLPENWADDWATVWQQQNTGEKQPLL